MDAISSIFVSFEIFSPPNSFPGLVKFNFSGGTRKKRQAGFLFDRDSVLEDKLRARLVRIDNRARGVERVSRVKCLKIAPPRVTLDSNVRDRARRLTCNLFGWSRTGPEGRSYITRNNSNFSRIIYYFWFKIFSLGQCFRLWYETLWNRYLTQ